MYRIIHVQTSFYIYWNISFRIWVNGVLLCTFLYFFVPLVSLDLYVILTMVHLIPRCRVGPRMRASACGASLGPLRLLTQTFAPPVLVRGTPLPNLVSANFRGIVYVASLSFLLFAFALFLWLLEELFLTSVVILSPPSPSGVLACLLERPL